MRDDEPAEVTEATTATATAAPVATENIQNAPETAEISTPAATEQPASEQATETPATPAAPAGPTAEEISAAVEAFMAKAHAAAGERDQASGEVPEAALAPVKIAYSELPVPQAKTKARNAVEQSMREALSKELDAPKARAYMLIGAAIKSTTSATTQVARAAVDPTTAHVDRVVAMYLAPNLVPVPEGVADNWPQLVQQKGEALKGELSTYKKWLIDFDAWNANQAENKGDAPAEPEVSQVVRDSARIARGRTATTRPRAAKGEKAASPIAGGSTYDGPRRHVKAHIQSAFASLPTGTFLKVSDICKHVSDEYGEDHPSGGAVTAALWNNAGQPKDIPGVTPHVRDGVKGAYKS